MRLTAAITTAVRQPEAKCSISCISANPWEEVAVKVRTPVSDADKQAAIAECSLSTLIILPPSFPSASQSESFS